MKKILIVDDQPDVKELLALVLKRRGREFFKAESGEKALELARKVKPDVILMDVMMPGGMDGNEATRILKSEPGTSQCPIITMTAKIQTEDRQEAFNAGADDFISKPFDIGTLCNKVNSLLKD